MAAMDADERRRFLCTGTRTAKLATVRKDGRPHVAAIWFLLDDDDSIVFMTGETSVKGRNLRHDPRACLCVDDDTPPFSYVVVEGTASMSEDLDEMLTWSTRIGGRYMGEENAEQFGRRNAVPGELLVRITPTHTVAQKDVAD